MISENKIIILLKKKNFFLFLSIIFILLLFPATSFAQADTDKLQENIRAPEPTVNIPGLEFSDADLEELQTQDVGPFGKLNTYYYFPYLGEYLAAVYRYAVGAAAIIAVIILIISGLQWASSAGNDDTINSAKKRIIGAVIGLIISVGSYSILYIINPNLVEFKNLKVLKVEGQEINAEGPVDEEQTLTLTEPSDANISSIQGRTLRVSSPNSFCFPLLEDGYRYNTQNWGQRRKRKIDTDYKRCHSGVDLLTEGKEGKGTVISMTNGEVFFITRGFYTCYDGKTTKTNPGEGEKVGAIYIYDSYNDLTYIYGEVNASSIKVKKGDRIRRGQILGTASKCNMLHLEIYKGKGRRTGDKMSVEGYTKKKSGWYIFEDLKDSLDLPDSIAIAGRSGCAQPPYVNILDEVNSALLDPRQFLSDIKGNYCDPNTYYPPAGDNNIENIINTFALCEGIKPAVLRQIAEYESQLSPTATRGSNYVGLFQESIDYCKIGLYKAGYTIGPNNDTLKSEYINLGYNCSYDSKEKLSGRFDPETNTAAAAANLYSYLQDIKRKCSNITAYNAVTLLYVGHNNGSGVMQHVLNNSAGNCSDSNIRKYVRDFYIERGGEFRGVSTSEGEQKYINGKENIANPLYGNNQNAGIEDLVIEKNLSNCPIQTKQRVNQ
ncbi:MAG: peptidoglycan DD-metalloendopeptidase family protein [Candidatus Magasanikbacteria bacterium]|nr:peptidoglycan DD-metalloendopeptidase family protein [Candidatus Magasanikbacteria bacterium]